MPSEQMSRPTRQLTPEEIAAVREMYERKARSQPPHGYVTTTAPVTLRKWNGNHFPSVEANMTEHPIPSGSILKIVMVSRFEDCGLTDNLAADYGYDLRLSWNDAAMSKIRFIP